MDGEHHDLLICNNNSDRVSRHLLRRREGLQQIASCGLLARGLRTPDGIALGQSDRLIAISNHDRRRVDIFANNAASSPRQKPSSSLLGLSYPHALRFLVGDRRLLVADAGAPFVRFYQTKGAWQGKLWPALSLRVFDDATFHQGRGNPREGGPKGLELLAREKVLALSCTQEPLAFYDIAACLPPALDRQGDDIASVRTLDEIVQNIEINLAREPGPLLLSLRNFCTRARKAVTWRANRFLWRYFFRAKGRGTGFPL